MALPLSIVVCTCNHADTLAGTLRAIAAQDAAPSSFEVVVVDNGCTDDTESVLAEARTRLPHLRTVRETKPGQVHARVKGVRESAGEWIAFVDDDNALDVSWVSAALRFAECHPACGAFGGEVAITWAEPPPPAVARRAYAYAATDLSGGTHRLDGEERWRLRGAGLVCRRRALLETGWLEWQANVGRVGQGLLGGDDTEIVMRIARAGWELWYEPACRLRHWIGGRRLSIPYFRALHIGFARADPLLLGFRDRGSLGRWAGRFLGLLARRLFALGRHGLRGCLDADARLTARLTLDSIRGNLQGIAAVVRLGPLQRRAWLGQTSPASARPRPDSIPTLRVLHLHSGRDYGGLERVLLCLGAHRAAAPGMEPTFGLGYRHRLARELSQVGASVEVLGAFERRRLWAAPGVLLSVGSLLRRGCFAVVVCHGSSALVSFRWLARAMRLPVVLWMHSDTKVKNKNLTEFLAGKMRPALVVCNSAFTAASLPLLFAVPPPHVVVHCPVPVSVGRSDLPARRRALRAEQQTSDDAVVIILPSRLERWKGHESLLDALAGLRANPRWTCWIVGGPFDDEQATVLSDLRARASAGGIADRVRFLGQRDDVPDLLAAADIFCQPNLTPEPFGVNAVEALYAGLPVVASDSGGTREIVDNTCGRLTPLGDVTALRASLAQLVDDPQLRSALGARAAARGRAVSDPDKILPLLQRCLADLTATSGAGVRRPGQPTPLPTRNEVSRE